MNSPIAIIDARSPREAIARLEEKGFRVVAFITRGITYEAVAGHPDVFITEATPCIIAPNIPEEYKSLLEQCPFVAGTKPVGIALADTTQYNCVVTDTFILHKNGYTDTSITSTFPDKRIISVSQAYTRCNTMQISADAFITSDRDIYRKLLAMNLQCLYVSPEGITLPPYRYGFIGGCMGRFADAIYINGSLATHPDGREIARFISQQGLRIEELHRGALYDGGGILFF